MFTKKILQTGFIKKFSFNLIVGLSALALVAAFTNSNFRILDQGPAVASAQYIEGIGEEYFPSEAAAVGSIGDESFVDQPSGNTYVSSIGEEYFPTSTYVSSIGDEYYPSGTYVSSIGPEYYPGGTYVSSIGPEYYPGGTFVSSVGPEYYPSYPTQYPSYPSSYPSYPTSYPSYPTSYPNYPTQYPSYPNRYPSYPTSSVMYPSYTQNTYAPSSSYDNNLESYNDNANSNSNSNSLNNDNENSNYSNNENSNDNYSNSTSEANSYSDSYAASYSNSESNANANVELNLNNEINLDNVNEQGQDQHITINFSRGGYTAPIATASATYNYPVTRERYTSIDQPRYSETSNYYGNYNNPTSTYQTPTYYVQNPYKSATASAQPKVVTVDGGNVATKELPKTGLPFAAAALAGLFPIGLKLRKFKGVNKSEESANFIWESRELGRN